MFFTSNNFDTYSSGQAFVKSIEEFHIGHAIFDDFLVSSSKNQDYTNPDTINPETKGLLIFADYSQGYGSKTSIDVGGFVAVRIKRRISEDSLKMGDSREWITIFEKDVDDVDTYLFSFIDFSARADTKYDYALIGVYDTGEDTIGDASKIIYGVESYVNGVVVANTDAIWLTNNNISFNRTRNQLTSTVTTLGNKYPFVIKNGDTNYESGSITALFIEYDKYTDTFNLDDSLYYRESLYNFLTDGKPKILKTHDGMVKIIAIDGNVTENDSSDILTSTTFNWIEIGDAQNNVDYDNSGLVIEG